MSIYNLLEYSSSYYKTTGRLWFFSNNEASNINADIANDDASKSFKFKAKLLGTTVADETNGIVKDTITAVLLQYLSDFGKSREMSLINCKVKLKLKWKNYCALSAVGADNANANFNDIILIIKDTKVICVCCHFISKRQPKTIKTS